MFGISCIGAVPPEAWVRKHPRQWELECSSYFWSSDTWGNLLEFQQERKGHRRALVGSSGIFSFTATTTVQAIIAGEHA